MFVFIEERGSAESRKKNLKFQLFNDYFFVVVAKNQFVGAGDIFLVPNLFELC